MPAAARAPLSQATLLTAAAAVAVAQAVETLTGRACQIKWVNDVYLDGKKLCGILTEASGSFEEDALRYACVGIGVNVRTRDFPEELAGRACSLAAGGLRNRLAAEIAARLMAFAADLGAREFLRNIAAALWCWGRTVAFTRGGEERALAVGIGGTANCSSAMRTDGRKPERQRSTVPAGQAVTCKAPPH